MPGTTTSAADYAVCLANLSARGWAVPAADDRFSLTDAGQRMRQSVEDQTDANFFAAWGALTPVEVDDLAARSRAIVDAYN